MSEPVTRPQRQLVPFDHDKWIATAIEKPALVLICSSGQIGVLLAKDLITEKNRIVLHAVQWTCIPLGFRLWWMKLRSRYGTVHLPDEWLFNTVSLVGSRRFHRALV